MRSFWLGSSLSLALGFGLSALMYFTLTSSQAENCQVNGAPCPQMRALELTLLCAMPAAVFLLIVLVGIRVKRHSPRVAAWLVSLPPAGLLVYAAGMAFVMPSGG
ncbi:hypothetical protein N787_14180 [Arenimonas metalli CF5-1]|uniref:Transmembrane protein n=1 Tax=Arenimonas metalli CF5-1 TaxID=1384056 RepID=A0A091APP6_9GAMM|nr:hypothetical protein N787_14180 [Arenimonas metalli CF5-1]